MPWEDGPDDSHQALLRVDLLPLVASDALEKVCATIIALARVSFVGDPALDNEVMDKSRETSRQMGGGPSP